MSKVRDSIRLKLLKSHPKTWHQGGDGGGFGLVNSLDLRLAHSEAGSI